VFAFRFSIEEKSPVPCVGYRALLRSLFCVTALFAVRATSSSNRKPEIENRKSTTLPRTRLDVVFDILTMLGVVAAVTLMIVYWPRLPERIPYHFGPSGEPDAWGGKGVLVVAPIIVLFVTSVLTAVMKSPAKMNYPVKITPENAERQYRLARNLLLIVRTEIAWTGAVVVWEQIQAGMRGASTFSITMLPLPFVLLIGTIVVYFVIARRPH